MSDEPAGNMKPLGFLQTDRLILRAVRVEDATEDYLEWLNNPTILRFRGPKAFPSTMSNLQAYLAGIELRGDLMLAICLKESAKHVGNITLNSVSWVHRTAELSIMIGAAEVWGQGLAKQAISCVAGHAFHSMGLNRLWAESPNPAFNAAVKSLGWKHEGTKREAFLLDGQFVNIECFGILKAEFVPSTEHSLSQ